MTAKEGRSADKKPPKGPDGPLRSRQALAGKDALEREAADDPGLPEAPEGIEEPPLDSLDPHGDPDELSELEDPGPERDSPGDSALLVKEELYEGISSAVEPSSKREDG